MFDEIGGGGGHAPAGTGRTGAAASAREYDDETLAAVGARQHGEASRRHAAVDEPLELVLDEARKRPGEALVDGGVERPQIVLHHAVERARLRTAARVRGPRDPDPCGGCVGHGAQLRNRRAGAGGEPVPADAERMVTEPARMAVVSSRAHPDAGALPGAVVFGSRAEGAVGLYLDFELA